MRLLALAALCGTAAAGAAWLALTVLASGCSQQVHATAGSLHCSLEGGKGVTCFKLHGFCPKALCYVLQAGRYYVSYN